MDEIQTKRKEIWNLYYQGLKPFADKGFFSLPLLSDYATNNAHAFYLVCNSLEERSRLITHLKANDVLAVFHYLSLHSSDYYSPKHDGRELPNCDKFADCLVRLPLFYELEDKDINKVLGLINNLFQNYPIKGLGRFVS